MGGGASGNSKKKGGNHQQNSGSANHLESDDKWKSLNKKEKQFCTEFNLKPTSYCHLKSQIHMEVAKNRKITEQFLASLQKKNGIAQQIKNQIPAIYEFMVNANIANPF